MTYVHYFLLDGDIIRDAIQYEVEGYTRVELDVEFLPAGINGGWYRWDGTKYNFDQQLYDVAHAGD